ncbi:MAG: DUF7453 family protein [Phycisphaerales bacterium]
MRFNQRFVAVSLFFFAPAVLEGSPPIRAVILSGDAAPGVRSQTFGDHASFTPVINAAGRVAFAAFTTGPEGNSSGVWAEKNGGLEVVALEGMAAPGGGVFDSFMALPVWLSDNGVVGFAHRTSGVLGIWAIGEDGLAVLAKTGDNSPNTDGTYSGLNGEPYVTFNKEGRAAFMASVRTSAGQNFVGLFNGAMGGVGMAARTQSGGFTSFGAPKYNTSDVFSVLASVADGSQSTGFYTGENNSLTAVASWNLFSGTHPEGFPEGVTYAIGETPSGINDANASVFAARLRGPGIDDSNDWGLWLFDDARLQRFAYEGMQVEDLPAGVQIADPALGVARFAAISDSGHIAFYCPMQSTDAAFDGVNGLFVRTPDGRLRTVARVNGSAPEGFAPGAVITSFGGSLVTPAMNTRGQVVFILNVTEPGQSPVEVVCATDSQAKLRVLWIVGRDNLQIRPGVTATLGGLAEDRVYPLQGGGSDGRRRSFNASGQFVFPASYRIVDSLESGSGVFVVTIPESCSTADVAGFGGGAGGDGRVTIDDAIFFISAYFAGNLAVADVASLGGTVRPDGQLSPDDLLTFFDAFFAGCP